MDKVEIKEYQNLSEPVRVTVVTGLLNMEGVRVPAGGKEGQNLTKKSDKDYDVYWADPDDINSIEHITLNGEEVPVENKTAKITVDKSTVGLENIYAELNENIIKNPEKTYLAYQGGVFNTAKSTNFQPAEGVVIDWGDGTTFVCTGTDAPITHNYTDGINCHLISISGATSIGYYWFADYAGILSAALGNTITVIDRGAFAYCSNLIQITIPETVNTILGHAFERSGLHNVIIPKSVIEIGAYAFSQTALRTVVILGNITSLGDNAFSLNSDLTDISIYGNIDLLAGSCFRQNTRLKNLGIYGNIGVCEEGSDFTACYDLSTVTFRGNVEEVPSFSIGKKLREVRFLGTVKTIPGGVFGECPKLQILYFSDKTPAKIGKSSYTDNIFTYAEKIVVPKDAIDTYKSAPNWSEYADKIVYEVDSSDLDKAITDLDVDNIAYKNKRNTFTQQMYIRNNNPYLTLGPNSQDEGNLGKDSLTFDYASGTKEVVTTYNRDYLYHYYYDSSTGEDIEAKLEFPTKSGTLALIEDLTAKLDKPTVADSNYKIVTYNGTNSDTIDYSNAPNASSIIQRDADGRAQVVSGVSGNDIVNYSQLETKYDKTGGTIGGNVVITGDLTVNGTQHINNTENLNVENAMIYSNAKGATLATNGGIGIKKNATDVYGIVYDPTSDSVKLGIGKSDANGRFTFNANEGQPVAIRDDSSKFTNNNLVKWDSESYKFVDAGKNVENLVDKLPASLRSQAYVRNANGEDSGLAYTYTDEGDTLAVRNASGQLQVSTPSQDNDAANKKFVEDNLNSILYPVQKDTQYSTSLLTTKNIGKYYTFTTSVLTTSDYWVDPDNITVNAGTVVKILPIEDSHGAGIKPFFKIVGIDNRELYLTNGQGKCSIVKRAYGSDTTPKAIGYYSNIFSVDTDKGFGGQVTSKYTTLFGVNVRADSNSEGSIVGGRYCIADSAYTLMYGKNLTTQGSNETLSKVVLGYNNKFNTKAILEIGNGTDTLKLNAFEVLDDNRAKVFGTPTENNDVLRYQDTAVEVETSLMGA